MTYKWANAHEWLKNKVDALCDREDCAEDELSSIIFALFDTVSGDDIQDVFQGEMVEDGYFDEIVPDEGHSNYDEE